ncbi:glycoside hydrolase family 2 TIM barrel-domain containing protein [Pullulanibacillus sp. KACC 23026]|uniref:glycoside hydrolase family 2 protein n=1 Tax=Pullulanibacillus sp. KACC 23026 TaxID=3028315 RepID=UPI0023B0B3EF|nr:sugar-binding domain-containing protein [Pullulanibacillus sp. KACC 23026]WEG10964.1 glycoside hydrolase family 2 TIM barrel-domain containing protein [Pullulanibacillus sp. KACC 23026]
MTSLSKKYEGHPTPQFTRNDWVNLNGEWDFAFDDENLGEKRKWFNGAHFDKKIIVPFTYETKASGIGDETFHPFVWYKRTFGLPEESKEKRVLLHFNASDYLTKVWVDGRFVGSHQGGYTHFFFDLTDYLNEEDQHELIVKVEDSMSRAQPRGKQRWIGENFGCWYVQTTGIWQTVWLELVNDTHLKSVKITPDIDTASITFNYELAGIGLKKGLSLKTNIEFDGQPVKTFSQEIQSAREELTLNISSAVDEWGIKLWHPDHPNLYDVTFTLYDKESVIDQVSSYFGMRKVSIENGKVLLNNTPIYQRLILDQGYWRDTHLTPPSEEALIEDIDRTLEMGFNGVRKHQKVEDPRYLYWCDRKGLLVWSEVAATYEFSDEAIHNFTNEWLDIVRQNYNHPSIIAWTPFNESWGVKNIFVDTKQQHFTESIYYLTKSLDSMRPVIVNDGWEHTISDIITLHDYEEMGDLFAKRYANKEKIVTNEITHNHHKYAMAKGYEYKGQPIILSEYGGIAFKEESGWGYGNQVNTEKEFFARYDSITQAIKNCDYIVGYCYTQITDVQQEINGLLTEDRKPKVDLKRVREINLK